MKIISFLFALYLVVPAPAQETSKFFRLDFALREFDENKLVGQKTYSTFATTDEKAKVSIRTNSRVPYQSGGPAQYLDVGTNIDVLRLQEVNGQLILGVTAEVSTIHTGSESPAMALPQIRQNRWNATVLVTIGKSATLFSSDDPSSKRKVQLELTATPVK